MKNIRNRYLFLLFFGLLLNLNHLVEGAELNPFNLTDPLIGKKAPGLETETWFNSFASHLLSGVCRIKK